MAEEKTVWYFAYGSNINEEVFCGRRAIKPLGKKLAILDGWRLIFNLRAIPFFETAMANVEPIREDGLMTPDHPRCVHGVAYQITAEQFDSMFKSEGDGRLGGYQLRDVKLRGYDGEEIQATTLSLPSWMAPSCKDFAPSKRYRDIIVNGAQKEGIKPEYIEWLAKKPYVDLAVFKEKYPGWFRFATYYSIVMKPFVNLVFWPVLFYLPYTPMTNRFVRRIIFFPADVAFLIGSRFFHRLADACVMLFGPTELKQLFCSSHIKL